MTYPPAVQAHSCETNIESLIIIFYVQYNWTYGKVGICLTMRISIKTAEAHRANMMKKLRVSNIAQLLKTALEEGLLATHASQTDSRRPAFSGEVPLPAVR